MGNQTYESEIKLIFQLLGPQELHFHHQLTILPDWVGPPSQTFCGPLVPGRLRLSASSESGWSSMILSPSSILVTVDIVIDIQFVKPLTVTVTVATVQ